MPDRLQRYQGSLLGLAAGDAVGTIAAVCGQIAGAYYGVEAIPPAWREQLTMAAEIAALAGQLHAAPAVQPPLSRG